MSPYLLTPSKNKIIKKKTGLPNKKTRVVGVHPLLCFHKDEASCQDLHVSRQATSRYQCGMHLTFVQARHHPKVRLKWSNLNLVNEDQRKSLHIIYIYIHVPGVPIRLFFLGCSCFWSKTKNFWKTHFWCHIFVLWCSFLVLWCRVFGCVSPLLACVMFLVETQKKTSNVGPGICIYIYM